MFRPYVIRSLTLAALLLAGGGCAPAIAPYSPAAYSLAIDAKVDALRLLELAEFPAEAHQRRIDAMIRDLNRATEFARGRPRNEYSTRQWELMRDPDGHLMGGLIARWQIEGSLKSTFLQAAEPLISQAFDSIIGLESGKLRSPNE